MAVIDFHSHILPTMDDGSKSITDSLQMLRMAAAQGVDWMVATPHFYASRDRLERFLAARKQSYELLKEALPVDVPGIRLGCEAAFFRGISTAERLDDLTVEGTKLILLEMPFAPWSDADIHEVKQLLNRGYKILLAHLERYLTIPENRRRIRELWELPVYIQINAGSLTDWRKRRTLVRMFHQGQAHFLGSDCHDVKRRVPDLAGGREVLSKKLGEEFLTKMDQEGSRLLQI